MAESARFLEAAVSAGKWLESVATETDSAIAWGWSADHPEPAPNLGWGSLGPVVFFADLYRATGDPQHLAIAEGGASQVRQWLEDPPEDLPPGLFTGLAGFAVVFHELASVGVDVADDLRLVFDRLTGTAQETEAGVEWWETTDVLWGTAGIGFLLLTLGRDVLGDDALALATKAGDWLISVAHPVDGGLRWDLGERPKRRRKATDPEFWFPSFSHGTAGIAAFLARLAAESADDRHLQAARAGTSWVLSVCRTDDDTCAAPEFEPPRKGDVGLGPMRDPDDVSPLYSLGWCAGPPGLGHLFRELERTTGETEWAEWIARTARSVRHSGIPERREPGFWDNVGRCCGSAGVAEYFLDLHTWREEPDDLEFALTVAHDLLDRGTTDEAGMRWSNVEFRSDPPELSPGTSWMQGASGIGSTLLRVARHLRGDTTKVQLPHEPNWDT